MARKQKYVTYVVLFQVQDSLNTIRMVEARSLADAWIIDSVDGKRAVALKVESVESLQARKLVADRFDPIVRIDRNEVCWDENDMLVSA